MSTVLVKSSKYSGEYVAFKDFDSHKVISSGKNAITVVKEAKKLGHAHPVILYIPKKDTAQIY